MRDQKRLSAEDRKDLVAYLDGEVESTVAGHLKEKIASSYSAQQEVEVLQRTWDLLDNLPMPAATGDFTNRTVELITRDDLRRDRFGMNVAQWGQRLFWVVLWLVGVAACFVVGWAVTLYWPDPNRRLVENLPVLQRYEAYRAIGDFEFLKGLHAMSILEDLDQPLRSEVSAEPPPGPPPEPPHGPPQEPPPESPREGRAP